ncbi:hypothetical protein BJX61DRAFT_530773 [Aspergillus egyptiacus]|nr:hypothetical protein BJX61DRAFT_530773 [Aspergillus egyptiacus]
MPPQAREGQREKAGKKERRKPARRDPEKRRQQNIQAQRKYREKLRERLDRLEALAGSAAGSIATGQKPAISTVNTTQAPSSDPPHIVTSPPVCNVFDVSTTSITATSLAECQPLLPEFNAVSSFDVWSPSPHAPLPDTSSMLSIWDPMTLLPQPEAMPSAVNVCVSELTKPIEQSIVALDKSKEGFRPSWTTTINCGCSNPHYQVQTQGPFSFDEYRIIRLAPSAPTADPYTNHLRIDTVCTITALSALSMHLGVTLEVLCGETSISSFFNPSATSTDALVKADTIRSVNATFKSLKPDLRPSIEQITIPHHPYIDLLPFPTLRKYLITHQGELDEDEFFHDMLTGLVCWGGAGVGKHDRNSSTGYASSGAPWDVRSWEGRMWFLKKYWDWLGGDDGELVRQSEWWRNVRGEDMLERE